MFLFVQVNECLFIVCLPDCFFFCSRLCPIIPINSLRWPTFSYYQRNLHGIRSSCGLVHFFPLNKVVVGRRPTTGGRRRKKKLAQKCNSSRSQSVHIWLFIASASHFYFYSFTFCKFAFVYFFFVAVISNGVSSTLTGHLLWLMSFSLTVEYNEITLFQEIIEWFHFVCMLNLWKLCGSKLCWSIIFK